MIVVPYSDTYKEKWDDIVSRSPNAPFFVHRDFLGYHGNRFEDSSLVVFNGTKPIAILPANISVESKHVISHAGLTFGGLFVQASVKTPQMVEIFESVLAYLKSQNIKKFTYKAPPLIYSMKPAAGDHYACVRFGGLLVSRELGTTIELSKGLPKYSSGRTEGVAKAEKAGIRMIELVEMAEFWGLLEQVLMERHDALPIHSLEEIEKLKSLFPSNIRSFGAYLDGELIAGALIFESSGVAHSQYLASCARGRENAALDGLLNHLIARVFREKHWFSFGTSAANDKFGFNEGLLFYKESFGGGAYVQDTYEFHLN